MHLHFPLTSAGPVHIGCETHSGRGLHVVKRDFGLLWFGEGGREQVILRYRQEGRRRSRMAPAALVIWEKRRGAKDQKRGANDQAAGGTSRLSTEKEAN